MTLLRLTVNLAFYCGVPATIVIAAASGDAITAAIYGFALGVFVPRDAGRLGVWLKQRRKADGAGRAPWTGEKQ